MSHRWFKKDPVQHWTQMKWEYCQLFEALLVCLYETWLSTPCPILNCDCSFRLNRCNNKKRHSQDLWVIYLSYFTGFRLMLWLLQKSRESIRWMSLTTCSLCWRHLCVIGVAVLAWILWNHLIPSRRPIFHRYLMCCFCLLLAPVCIKI